LDRAEPVPRLLRVEGARARQHALPRHAALHAALAARGSGRDRRDLRRRLLALRRRAEPAYARSADPVHGRAVDHRRAAEGGRPLRAGRRVMRALLLVMILFWGSVQGQPFPSKPITIVVPFPPGGGVDFIARIVADKLPARLGRPVVVDNRGGALGMLGASVAARAAPDGHTLFLIPNSLIIAPYILPKGAATVEITREFAPVIMIVSNPIVLAVNPKLGVST